MFAKSLIKLESIVFINLHFLWFFHYFFLFILKFLFIFIYPRQLTKTFCLCFYLSLWFWLFFIALLLFLVDFSLEKVKISKISEKLLFPFFEIISLLVGFYVLPLWVSSWAYPSQKLQNDIPFYCSLRAILSSLAFSKSSLSYLRVKPLTFASFSPLYF